MEALAKVADVVKGSNVKLAAQDVHWENQGAFTGKVSAGMLKDAGYAITGSDTGVYPPMSDYLASLA